MSDQYKPADDTSHAPADQLPHWIEGPGTVNLIVKGLYVAAALALLLDVVVHKHSAFAIEHLFGFYGFYGFIGCVLIVVAAKGLRTVLVRPEDYYDR